MPRTHDDAADAILRAARRLLADEGPHALTVRRIAAEAGGSTMNVYSRFGGKEGVVDALFAEGFARLGESMRRVRTTDDPVADLRRCCRAYRTFAREHPTYYAVMFERAVPDHRPGADALEEAAATLHLLRERVQRAVDSGLLAGDPMHLAAAVWGTCHGLVSLELKQVGPPDIDWAHRTVDAVDALLRGFAAPS